MEPGPQIAEIEPVPQIAKMEPVVPEIAEMEPVPEIAEMEPVPQIAEMEPVPQIAEMELIDEKFAKMIAGSAGYSLSAPLVNIYGNDLYVADQCNKATKGNGNLYLADVTNFDVRGHINTGFLRSDKTYVAKFYVDGVYTDVKIAVYDSTNKEIKNATKTYSHESSSYNISLTTGPFKKPTSGDELTFRLVRRGKTCLKSITIKRITLHEE